MAKQKKTGLTPQRRRKTVQETVRTLLEAHSENQEIHALQLFKKEDKQKFNEGWKERLEEIALKAGKRGNRREKGTKEQGHARKKMTEIVRTFPRVAGMSLHVKRPHYTSCPADGNKPSRAVGCRHARAKHVQGTPCMKGLRVRRALTATLEVMKNSNKNGNLLPYMPGLC